MKGTRAVTEAERVLQRWRLSAEQWALLNVAAKV
jgi:hypothetical protein